MIKELKKSKFRVIFMGEGNIEIKLPHLRYSDLSSLDKIKIIDKCFDLSTRPTQELLLRKIVFNLYEQGIIDKSKSIVDIGAWIGDNSLVWSKLLNGRAKVFAIEPSPENIFFGKMLSKINQCENITWHQEVCSNKANVELYFEGSGNHAVFNEEGGKQSLRSTTIDSVVGEENWGEVGLMHVDVEGLEKKVLEGSKEVIDQSKPFIIFEQHIGREDPSQICRTFGEYDTYMINEVLPNCDLDCRNFISIPRGSDVSKVMDIETDWYATVGPALIPYGGS
tara:strand:- start:116 stop:955 length:840 start_codon:yes stop_codon:yes gene_type:complete